MTHGNPEVLLLFPVAMAAFVASVFPVLTRCAPVLRPIYSPAASV